MKQKILIRMRVILSEFSASGTFEAGGVLVASILQSGGSSPASDLRTSSGDVVLELYPLTSCPGGDSLAANLQSTSDVLETRDFSASNLQTSPDDVVLVYDGIWAPSVEEILGTDQSKWLARAILANEEYLYEYSFKHGSQKVVAEFLRYDPNEISIPKILAALASNNNLKHTFLFVGIRYFL